jgi:AcrR family transcriptional regulator
MTTTLFERLGGSASPAGPSPERRPSAARERILAAAGRLFYDEGIHAVGVERVLTEADVTRVTFYRHFPSKDALIEAYLRVRGDRMRDRITAVHGAVDADPRRTLDAIAETLVDDRSGVGFRGCEFVNAAAEYADTAHPARTVTVLQRGWLMDVTTEALQQLGHPRPRRLARQLLMLRTGASVASDLDDDEDIGEVFLEAWQAMLAAGLAATGTSG